MTNENVELSLLRGAVIPTAITGAIAMGISAVISGMAGFLGALLAQFIVVIFFAVTIFVSRISRNLDPISTMGLALFSYTTKLLFVGVFLWLLTTYTDRESINRTSFGVTAILLTLSWLGGEIASYTKLRIHLPLPGGSNSGNGSGNESGNQASKSAGGEQ
jgi:fructose-specific phosphotransferase system IIC component